MSFKLESYVDDQAGYLVLSPQGELDIYNTPDFKKESVKLYDASPMDILIDGDKLKYVDSTGLGGFIQLLNHLKGQDHHIYFKNIKDNIRKLFVITKLDEVFTFQEEDHA
ncbi:MAG: STAS domain-containing protein [Tissierellia bacterium]|nr:STAS domain-containing protein [Tissierellia bacterium]